jgi:hypothetical protein
MLYNLGESAVFELPLRDGVAENAALPPLPESVTAAAYDSPSFRIDSDAYHYTSILDDYEPVEEWMAKPENAGKLYRGLNAPYKSLRQQAGWYDGYVFESYEKDYGVYKQKINGIKDYVLKFLPSGVEAFGDEPFQILEQLAATWDLHYRPQWTRIYHVLQRRMKECAYDDAYAGFWRARIGKIVDITREIDSPGELTIKEEWPPQGSKLYEDATDGYQACVISVPYNDFYKTQVQKSSYAAVASDAAD